MHYGIRSFQVHFLNHDKRTSTFFTLQTSSNYYMTTALWQSPKKFQCQLESLTSHKVQYFPNAAKLPHACSVYHSNYSAPNCNQTALTSQYGTLWICYSLSQSGLSERAHSGEAGFVLRERDLYPGAGILVSLLFAF